MSDDTTPPLPPEGAPAPPPPPPPTYGSAPPPPPPAYGSAPPPPYTGAPGAPVPAGSGPYDATEAIKYGWAKFSKSPATLLVPVLIVIVIAIVVDIVVEILVSHTVTGTHACTRTIFNVQVNTSCGPGFLRSLLGSAIIGGISTFVGQALSAGLIRSALNVVDGREVNAGDVLTWATKPKVITTAAIIGGAAAVGTLLCYVGAIVVAVLTAFAMYYVVDKDQAPADAIRSSISFVTGNFGSLVIFYLLSVVVIIVGAILCGVGLLAAIPVVLIASAYTWRILHHQPVSPVG